MSGPADLLIEQGRREDSGSSGPCDGGVPACLEPRNLAPHTISFVDVVSPGPLNSMDRNPSPELHIPLKSARAPPDVEANQTPSNVR